MIQAGLHGKMSAGKTGHRSRWPRWGGEQTEGMEEGLLFFLECILRIFVQ